MIYSFSLMSRALDNSLAMKDEVSALSMRETIAFMALPPI